MVGYNLEMEKARPGSPYRAALRGTGICESADMARHHVVPYNQLRGLWNGDHGEKAGKLLKALMNYLVFYRVYGGLSLVQDDIQHVRQLCADIMDGSVTHDSGSQSRPEGWDSFCEVYTWLPGNLFIGPKERTDDPGENFETGARPIFSSAKDLNGTLFEKLSLINEKISGKMTEEAYGTLAVVASRPRYMEFDEVHWVQDSAAPGKQKKQPKNPKPKFRIKS
ncbi:hypothetical protein ACFRAR_15875 [Kitasatospora sp. NPDC056651]|uniref:hypothetical protein n=1 Tax=Kitasatospora sp. NPDC056651 TaxID=3345892 RepID=UPI0036AE6AD9